MTPTTLWTTRLLTLVILSTVGFAKESAGSSESDQEHWAFLPIDRPAIPENGGSSWPRNPIDAFILAGLEDFELQPAPEANRPTLLRRLSFDLRGLPPTPQEIAAFAADDSPEAYESLVDRLLASPHFGERWGQHWLDLARYADTDGFEMDHTRPHIWRYRDWVVNALNADLPYDQFVSYQLAGDELAPSNPEVWVGTGFNRCYPDMVDMNDQGLRRQNALNDITETAGLVFLGLTVGCARCHDHKFDPIPQADFYRLQAFFAPAEFRNDVPIATPEQQSAHQSARRAWQAERDRIKAALESTDAEDERSGLLRRLDALDASQPTPLPLARVLGESSPDSRPTHLLVRGEYTNKGPEVQPRYLSILDRGGLESDPKIQRLEGSTGRRTALAEWLTDPEHPLTARVIVNRLWQHHFGRGIVGSPSDFGTLGEPPTHPKLLDWLASELTTCDWNLKEIHRLILTSATYRQSSQYDPKAFRIDPEAVLRWRWSRRRLDGETIRDSLLASAGTLDRRIGGPCIYPALPEELTRLSSKGAIWPVSTDAADRNRRSLYVFTRRNLRFPFFEAFDRPDTNVSCPQRAVTTIAPQALALMNGSLPQQAAHDLVERLDIEAGDDQSVRIALAYRLTLGRFPDVKEVQIAEEFLISGVDDPWYSFALALLNLNEFIYFD